MDPNPLRIDDLGPLADQLRRRLPDIAYLVLQDRTDRDTTVGRFDLNPEAARAWLDPGEDHPPDDDPPDDDPLTDEELVDLAITWVTETATDQAEGHAQRRFRVRCMGAKGASMVHSHQFLVRAVPAEPKPYPALPEADLSTVTHDGVTRSLHALGELYARFGQLVLGAVGNLQRIHDTTTEQLHAQLQESRSQTDLLVGSILEARAAEVTVAHEHKAATDQADARHTLARDAIQQIGEAARALLGAQGVPADAAEVLDLLRASPSLQTALADPSVRALMRQPGQLDQLAALLKTAAAQAAPAPEVTP